MFIILQYIIALNCVESEKSILAIIQQAAVDFSQ
jgi:hypothetical protein